LRLLDAEREVLLGREVNEWCCYILIPEQDYRIAAAGRLRAFIRREMDDRRRLPVTC